MASKYYSEERMRTVREALERTILDWPGVSQKKMFGTPSYWRNGKMFAFLVNGAVVPTLLSEEDRSVVAERFRAQPFGAGPRVVKRWPQLPVSDPAELRRALPFVKKSYDAVR